MKRNLEVKQVAISLPTALLERLDLLLKNPMTGKIHYGARSQLISSLLQEWVVKREAVVASRNLDKDNFETLLQPHPLTDLPSHTEESSDVETVEDADFDAILSGILADNDKDTEND